MPEELKAPSIWKLYLRGTITNSLGLAILFGLYHATPQAVIIALGLQWLVFIVHALPFSSETFYDLSGSLTHLAVILTPMVSVTRARTPRQLVCAFASVIWMTRLGSFLFLRIRKDGKDERFDAIKQCWLAFLGAWTLQAVWVVLIQLPVLLINQIDDTAPLGAADAVALVGWLFAFFYEALADVEKFTFRSDPANRHTFITSGLWSYSRHPNYFGEILMWCCMAGAVSVAGIATGDASLQLAWLCPAFTTVLLLKVSGVPMVEKAGEKKWGSDPAYRNYMDKTSMLLPWKPAPPLPPAPRISTGVSTKALMKKFDSPRKETQEMV